MPPSPALLLRRRPWAVGALALVALLPACAGGADTSSGTSAGTSAAAPGADSAVPAGFPVTMDSCGREITLPAPPERVLLLGRAGIMRMLLDLGAADRVAARAGAYPDAYYDREGRAVIAGIDSLGEDLDESGHLQISQEAILEVGPDLVIGVPDGIDEAGLVDVGIPVLEQPAACPEGIPDVSFDDVYGEVERYGRLFDRQDRAGELVVELEQRVEDVAAAAEQQQGRTAAVLYPTVGGGTVYAYGTRSMSHEQLEIAGLTNVFGDTDERVFEVTTEELLARDPDVLVLLHVDGEPGPVEQAVRSLPGAEGLAAVREDQVLTMLFDFGEYPTPIAVDGLERIAERFGAAR